tara:strand:- start:398 stop:652 length:255 start_codon:yes stop_codon:yes gene_type:complete
MPFVFIFSGTGGGDMTKENLTSQVDSERTQFQISGNYQTNSLRVYYNGVRQVQGEHFTEVTDQSFSVTFTPQTGDFINVEYVSK